MTFVLEQRRLLSAMANGKRLKWPGSDVRYRMEDGRIVRSSADGKTVMPPELEEFLMGRYDFDLPEYDLDFFGAVERMREGRVVQCEAGHINCSMRDGIIVNVSVTWDSEHPARIDGRHLRGKWRVVL